MRVRVRSLLQILWLFALIATCAAAPEQPPKITKMVTRMITIASTGETAAKPKILYRAGKTYSRLEEERDPEQHMHRLIVTNEPDSWIINLEDHTATHVVDEGPEFVTSMPIFWGLDNKPEKEFESLEFGSELDYFRNGRAKEIGMRKVEGKDCKALSLKTGEHEVILYLDPKHDRPYRIDLIKYGRLTSAVRYLSYDTGLPFDKVLFTLPKDINVSEGH